MFGLPAALADLRLTAADRIPGGDDEPKKSTKSSAKRKNDGAGDEPPRERKAPASRGGAKRRSKSVELTILGASTLLTESSAVLLWRKVALPANFKPLFVSVPHSCGDCTHKNAGSRA